MSGPVFVNVGLSHRQAPIAVREQVTVAADALPARLEQLKALPGVREALLVSTCNRLEVFAVAERQEASVDISSALGAGAAGYLVTRVEEEAFRHLFRVCASLDSMVVGEAQILGQVKEAAEKARELGVASKGIDAALQRAVGAAKRVRTDTAIARGAVSVSSIAVDLAHKVLGDLSGKCVLLIGAGEMATLAARELIAQGAREVLVANRSPARAEELAKQIGGIAASLGELPSLLERADVAICSAAVDKPLITRELMHKVVKARRYRSLFLVDLSLPRNVDGAVNQLDNCYVYDLDDLERVAAGNRELREAEVVRAEAIVEEELRAFLAARRERDAVPVLARLRAQAQSIAEAEVERTLAALGPLSDKQQKSVRAMAAAIVNKLLHGPTAQLRREAGEGPLAKAAEELFELASGDRAAPPTDGENGPHKRAG